MRLQLLRVAVRATLLSFPAVATPAIEAQIVQVAMPLASLEPAFYGFELGAMNNVAGLGDVDLDGHPDFAVANVTVDTPAPGAGVVRVYSGKDRSLLFTLSGETLGGSLGASVSAAGDVNGDGHADLLVGANLPGPAPGTSWAAVVFSGQDGSILRTAPGEPSVGFIGLNVASARDVNGDGVPDMVVGCQYADTNGVDSGAVRVFSGANGALLHAFDGSAAGAKLGRTVCSPGDLDGDGVSEIVFSAPKSFAVQVRSGADGALLYDLMAGSGSGNLYTGIVAVAGDLDHDGVQDIVATGSTGISNAGAHVYSGVDGAPILTLHVPNPASDGEAVSVAGLGDVNLDGTDDLVLGLRSGIPDAGGNVYILSGQDGSILQTIHAFGYPCCTGITHASGLAGPGDLDHDGHPDVLVSCPADLKVVSGMPSVWSVGGFQGYISHYPSSGPVLPLMLHYGSLAPGSPVMIGAAHIAAKQPAFLVLGTQNAWQPFLGVGLFVVPSAVIGMGTTLADGSIMVNGRWPAGVPSGAELYAQIFVQDPQGPQGWGMAGPLRATAP